MSSFGFSQLHHDPVTRPDRTERCGSASLANCHAKGAIIFDRLSSECPGGADGAAFAWESAAIAKCHEKCHINRSNGVAMMSTPKRPGFTGSARTGPLKTEGRSTAVGSKMKTKAIRTIAAAALRQTKPRGGHLVVTFLDSKGLISVGRVAKRFGMSKVQL